MRKYIKCCLFALLALPFTSAGAQTIPFFPINGPQVIPPPVPLPTISSVPAVSSAAAAPASTFTFSGAPEVAFSGRDDIAALLEGAIRASTSTVEIAVYGFTLPGVAQAIVDAKERGVKVRVICNESHLFTTRISEQLQLLIDKGVDLRALRGVGRFGIMHNKLGIYDGRLVSAGSFNWAVTANEANSENAVFIRDPHSVEGYRKYFDWMWGFAKPVADGPGAPVKDYGPPPEDGTRPVQFNGMLLPAYSFSPGGRTEANITAAVNFAREKADIAVFSFYSTDIAQAVVNAHKRGVAVRVLVDRVQASQSEVGELLLKSGVPFRWSQGFAGKGVMHNKYAVLDSALVLTGSFNWSVNAQDNNFENVHYTAAPSMAAAFGAQFDRLFAAAETPTLEDMQKARALYRAAQPGAAAEY